MKITKCTMEQLDETAAFYDKVVAYLDAHVKYPKWKRGEYPGRESTAQAISEGVQYICTEKGKIAGAFILNDVPLGDYSAARWSLDLKEGDYLVIHTLAADPQSYHRGIGRFMVEYCIKTAREDGYRALRVDTVPDNFPARRLYESMGFTYAGIEGLNRNIEGIPEFALYELNFIGGTA